MAVLFVLAIGLIVWRASRVEPLSWPAYQQATRTGEQLFPIAVPADAARQTLHPPASRADLLRQISVARADDPAAACDLYARFSFSHWRRWPMSLAALAELGIPALSPGESARARITATDLVDDDDGDGRPLDAGEIHAAPEGVVLKGVEVEIYCRDAEVSAP